MYELLALEPPVAAEPLSAETAPQPQDNTYALEAAAIGYHRLRREAIQGVTETDKVLRGAIAISNTPVYTTASVKEFKQQVEIAAKLAELGRFTERQLALSRQRGTMAWVVAVATLIIICTTIVKFHLGILLSEVVIVLMLVLMGVIFYKIYGIRSPSGRHWARVSVEEYTGRSKMPADIIARAVTIIRLAPAAEFYVDQLGQEALLSVASCYLPRSLQLYIGRWNEASPRAQAK